MLNTECKQCHKKWHRDNAKYCSMCGKELIDEPEFKVGDYVVDDGSYLTTKVDEISNSVVECTTCYNFRYFTVRNNFVCEIGYLRHATPEEIAEYESALSFHKHGRKPFELKKGDLLYDKNSENNFTYSGIAPNMTINKLKTGEYIFFTN